jgi:2'-5' RNA ligase
MELINSYAIVAYVAGPVSRFVDRLREDLVPGTGHHAHITVLPPRPLTCPPAEAIEFARQMVSQFEPFEVRVGPVQVFENTQVIHLAVLEGAVVLAAMHGVLNTGVFAYDEPHPYIPHVTLGQQLAPEGFQKCVELSRRRWEDFGDPPAVRIESLTFVQQRGDGKWVDLAELALGRVPTVG